MEILFMLTPILVLAVFGLAFGIIVATIVSKGRQNRKTTLPPG